MKHRYLIALGSNQRHPRFGAPRQVLTEALQVLEGEGLRLVSASRVITSEPIGPSLRRYANGAAVFETTRTPDELLSLLKQVERAFGRRGGRRWGPRILDLDIILWSEGPWAGGGLVVPHPEFRRRRFVLEPLAEIAPVWRDPITGATPRRLLHRLGRRS